MSPLDSIMVSSQVAPEKLPPIGHGPCNFSSTAFRPDPYVSRLSHRVKNSNKIMMHQCRLRLRQLSNMRGRIPTNQDISGIKPGLPSLRNVERGWYTISCSFYSPSLQVACSNFPFIRVLQKLIRTHPFSTWPLHVKLFTEEAVHCWNTVASTWPLSSHLHCGNPGGENNAFGNETTKGKEQIHYQLNQRQYQMVFPPGFICSIELEGVDGSSGLRGSGREGPVCVTDGEYYSSLGTLT